MLKTVLLLGGTALLDSCSWRLGPSKVLEALGHIGWYLVPVILLGGGHHALRALALRACVLRLDLLRYGEALAIRLSGEASRSRRDSITEYLICSFVTSAMSIAGLSI